MSRSERLLALLQLLRTHRRPVSGGILAKRLGISIRTLYRDIASLQARGADIEGEPGLGYVLRPGFMLPPIMFNQEEIEALVLGARWVADRGDAELGMAARNVLAKVAAVMPEDSRPALESVNLLVGPRATGSVDMVDIAALRGAIRTERKIGILYSDAAGAPTERLIWPFALTFFDKVRVLLAWCEMRQDFRHFRTDRILSLNVEIGRYPKRRSVLLKEWKARQGIVRDFD
ncbi:putative DNA-binding transcriptional regulator YafY [Ochrobactrum daejeonense]|uniref:Putative DNA-binding transcriptional regulator YafY n=1 Tax=Brucella daejeonensis TaxID=659015 RepID=A0A7W9AZJ1_9HYPH|nr:YafY family protein [Brucella daejeonensis]MBB5703488.1 putative DNA-binding transcriptional regulator YafY [Brucella daejeonensis]